MDKKTEGEPSPKKVYRNMRSLFRLLRRLQKTENGSEIMEKLFEGQRMFTYTPKEYKQNPN